MFSKKYCLLIFLLLSPGLFLYSQSQDLLKNKIKLDTTYKLGADIYALSQAGDYTAFGDENGDLFVIDKSGAVYKTAVKHTGWINSLSYNSSKNILASGGSDGLVSIYSISEKQQIKTVRISNETIKQLQFISDSLLLAAADKLYLINIETGKILNDFTEQNKITALCITPDKKTALLGLADGKISVFDIDKFKRTKQIIKHTKEITALVFSNDGKDFVSGDKNGTFVIWQAKTYKALKSLKAHSDEIGSILFSNDNKYIVTAGWDKNIFVWNRTSFKLELNINAHKNIVSSILFNNGKFYSASFDNTIKAWSNF